jgi:hypothetical protein
MGKSRLVVEFYVKDSGLRALIVSGQVSHLKLTASLISPSESNSAHMKIIAWPSHSLY